MPNKYTSPLFGSKNLMFASPVAQDLNLWEHIVRYDKTLYNDKNQVYSADVFYNVTGHALGFGRTAMQIDDYTKQFTLTSNNKQPVCIFALPILYGNAQNTAEGYDYEKNAWAINTWYDMPAFAYFILALNKSNTFRVDFDNAKQNGSGMGFIESLARVDYNVPYADYGDTPVNLTRTDYTSNPIINRYTTPQSEVDPWGLQYWLNVMREKNGSGVRGYRYHGVDIPAGFTTDPVLNILKVQLDKWETEFADFGYISVLHGYAQDPFSPDNNYFNRIGSNAISGFPIFALDSFDEMKKYFAGEAYVADNDQVPADWSTDWDIYIKGAQKPDIFITMKSDKVDAWLEDLGENRGGAVKEDIDVEYRIRIYEDPALPYELSDFAKDIYNNMYPTSYIDNIAINYQSIKSVLEAINEFSDPYVLYEYYAQLEFRIKYGKYQSSWCYYKIGVIGSPSVPDFELMQNEGMIVQDETYIDKSTVTLHYDEYPPDYDPWPIPPNPPMPPIGPTDPSEGINGSGLLTTIYRLTEQQAMALGRFLWSGDIFQKIKALNTSPISNIVGLYYMPIFIAGTTSIINIGDVDTNINADEISGSTPLYELGSVEYKGRYQNFVDFEPYTNAHIFLPFVGFVRLNPVYFTNKTLKVVYAYDLVCGLCNAMLFADGVYVESHQGNCGIEIPLESSNRAQVAIGLASGLFHTALSLATTKGLSAITAVAAGGSVFDSIMSAADSFSTQRQGNYSPATAWCETRQCFLVIESPDASYTGTFNHDFGRPCMASHNISQLSGFTVVDANVDLRGFDGATKEEIDMIRDLLSTGFYA